MWFVVMVVFHWEVTDGTVWNLLLLRKFACFVAASHKHNKFDLVPVFKVLQQKQIQPPSAQYIKQWAISKAC